MDFSKIKNDFVSGFSVFLLALPLCLGIAMASQFPPIAGVFTAIVGGVVSTFLGSTRLSIKGPAAGLIVIVLGSVMELGGGDPVLGYKRTLAVGCVAAVIQILIALFRKAVVAEIMPPSVIHGMLAAIGVIIISKQAHVMMGVAPIAKKPLMLLTEIPHSFMEANPAIILIGISSFLIALLWPKIKKLSFVPGSIVVLSLSVALSLIFDVSHEHQYEFYRHSYNLDSHFLINLPGSIWQAVTLPDFSIITSVGSIKYIIMFALVGSIESLLTVCAIDAIDPEKKQSDLNKDLFAVGVGNLISSFVGGLPMISEIVRSKANIDYGAKTRLSNFFHGLLLLLSILLIPNLIQLVPLAALAALLVFTGLRLASPKEFVHVYHIGKDQFFLFFTTFMITLLEDLLLGVAVGILLKIVLHILRSKTVKGVFVLSATKQNKGDYDAIEVKGPLTFIHYLKLKKMLSENLANKRKVVVDLSHATLVDHAIMDKLQYLKNETNRSQFDILGLDRLKKKSSHDLSVRTA